MLKRVHRSFIEKLFSKAKYINEGGKAVYIYRWTK